jgi:hypothetical protein
MMLTEVTNCQKPWMDGQLGNGVVAGVMENLKSLLQPIKFYANILLLRIDL